MHRWSPHVMNPKSLPLFDPLTTTTLHLRNPRHRPLPSPHAHPLLPSLVAVNVVCGNLKEGTKLHT